MSTDLTLLQQSGGALSVPSSLQGIMQQDQSSELSEGVGPSYAVVTIKGKTFGIRHSGSTTPMTVTMNGAVYAAPFFDVLLVKASAALSKTYYKDGYQEGDNDAPDCWAEDGVNPLAPLDQRPIDPRTNAPCVDCRACPMNVFGSRISDNGSKAKACADTRKIAVLPVVPTGQLNAQGVDPGRVDFDNSRFGGPMMLRVPAASLRSFAEYDASLRGMGLPYYGVVTRMQFDPAFAYPKFVLQPVRGLSEAEAQDLVAVRSKPTIDLMLTGGHTAPQAAPALAAPQQAPQQAAPAAPAVLNQPEMSQAAPPPPADPLEEAKKDGWQAHPQSPPHMWRGTEVLTVEEVKVRYAAAPAAPVQAPPPPPVQNAPIAQAAAPNATVAPVVSEGLLQQVDSLLNNLGV